MRIPKDFFTSSPNVFVGRFGYPKIKAAILSPIAQTDNAYLYDAPQVWAKRNYSIESIMGLRSQLLRSGAPIHVKENSHFTQTAQLISMARKPVEMDIHLQKVPYYKINISNFIAPMGPLGQLKEVKLTSHPSIDKKVEYLVSDTDCLATTAIKELYDKGCHEQMLTKLLSCGTLGIKRKFVPTRWSITAVDDILAKKIISEISYYDTCATKVYFGNYLGNYYLIAFLEGPWSYELFEISSQSQYSTDYEGVFGRKEYAAHCEGGYYAARLPLLEKLKDMKQKGSILALRIITKEYHTPLGVFVVREAVRKALESKPIEFSSHNLALHYMQTLTIRKFGIKANEILMNSKIIKSLKTQFTLDKYL